MFKKSLPSTDPDLFSSVSQHLSGRKYDDLVNSNAWHNVFYGDVVSQIDESIFKPIFSNRMGRPNASIRILVGMIILKEGQDWTDLQLYENCRFNIAIMRALGLTNIDDEVPVESTYYEFKSRLEQYYRDKGVNLFSELFRHITTSQISKYQIGGNSIRMDSKLIQSNIGSWSRLQKILQAFQVFYKSLNEDSRRQIRKKSDKNFIGEIMSKSAGNHLYGMNKDQKEDWLNRMGFLIRKVLNIYSTNDSKHYEVLDRMYHDHFKENKGSEGNNGTPSPRDKEEMQADSIQSIHDPDAAYRRKGHGVEQQKVSGYSSNITETLDEKINLITDVQVEKATYSDDKYLVGAIENTEKVTGDVLENIHTD